MHDFLSSPCSGWRDKKMDNEKQFPDKWLRIIQYVLSAAFLFPFLPIPNINTNLFQLQWGSTESQTVTYHPPEVTFVRRSHFPSLQLLAYHVTSRWRERREAPAKRTENQLKSDYHPPNCPSPHIIIIRFRSFALLLLCLLRRCSFGSDKSRLLFLVRFIMRCHC